VSVPLTEILAKLDKVQDSRLPLLRVRARPGELTLLRALADAVREQQMAGGPGKHKAG
jgi:hypothetical protein